MGGSNSHTSINRELARFAAKCVDADCSQDVETILLDLNDFAMPVFSVDLERQDGIPDAAKRFVNDIEGCDGVVISLAEHNGSYSVGFKNVFDWASRYKVKVWSEKPMLLMATSPGGRGGAGVLGAASATFPHMGAEVVATFSLPAFSTNFDSESGILDTGLKTAFEEAVSAFAAKLVE